MRSIKKKELSTIRKLFNWKKSIKNMELGKSIDNLERIYPKANYFIASNNPFLSILPKIKY